MVSIHRRSPPGGPITCPIRLPPLHVPSVEGHVVAILLDPPGDGAMGSATCIVCERTPRPIPAPIRHVDDLGGDLRAPTGQAPYRGAAAKATKVLVRTRSLTASIVSLRDVTHHTGFQLLDQRAVRQIDAWCEQFSREPRVAQKDVDTYSQRPSIAIGNP